MSVPFISLFGSLKQNFKFTISTIKRKWQWLYMKGWEYKCPISTTMKLWILCQDRISALSLFAKLEVVLLWSELHVTWWFVIWFLWSAEPYLLNTCGLDYVILNDCVLHRWISGGSGSWFHGWRPRTDQQLACHCNSWDTSTRSIATRHRVSCVLDWGLWKTRGCSRSLVCTISLFWKILCKWKAVRVQRCNIFLTSVFVSEYS